MNHMHGKDNRSMDSTMFLMGGTYGVRAMPPPVLNVSHLTKRFGAFTAVDDVSFHVNPGEIVGLLGPNGAGKTTTFHMLLGLITPTSGTVHMFGLDLAVEREAVLQQVNFSSTYLSMPQSLTVEENLWVVGRLYGLPNMRRRVDEIVNRLEMADFRHKVTRKLSSGQMTRLTLAKALLTKPKILFLDEPTASLDPDVAHKTRAILKEERRVSGLSILYTSHNMQEMEDMCDRIIFLQRGKIAAEGTSDDILRRFGGRNLEDVFLALARDPAEFPTEAALIPLVT
jgi:ABC-2 type transport system ATP-binding protein